MKKFSKKLSIFLLVSMMVISLWGCSGSSEGSSSEVSETTDFASLELNMESETLKQEVTVEGFVDGDTTYFKVPTSIVPTGAMKARYLAIDTPETTGKIEEFGKKASNFTREKLSKASSIIIESDDANWNLDSTGGRYLVWVWYKEAETDPYRNLNIEILQNGLARASSSANNRYGDTCMAALNYAKNNKLNVFSGEKDPDFFYGDAIELTIKELRTNIKSYEGSKVAFNGVVTKRDGNGVYIESYDADTDMYNGMYVYYGFTLSDDGLDILSVGNEVRAVGTVSYYEAGDNYQVTGPSYRAMKPDDPNNIRKLSEGHEPVYRLISASDFADKKVEIEADGKTKELPYAELALGTTVEMKDIKVNSIHTTLNKESNSYGAMTMDCVSEGVPIKIRTTVLKNENGDTVTEEAYLNKTIDVKGIVDYFHGDYQIKVLSAKDIIIK